MMTEVSNGAQPAPFVSESPKFNALDEHAVRSPPTNSSDLAPTLPPSEQSISEEEKDKDLVPSIDGSNNEKTEKRERKKVQRLSETLSQAHVEMAEKRAKVAEELSSRLEQGTGTELKEIPLIEAAIRKTALIALKPLHSMIFGRPGVVHEVRSNIRKFRGFSFQPSSPDYTKKLSLLNQRSTSDLRDALRILNLEVGGSREQLAARLMMFLMQPSPKLVKYKGKIVKKSKRGRPKGDKKSKSGSKVQSKKTSLNKTASSEASAEGTSRTEEDEESDVSSSLSETSSEASPQPRKRRSTAKPNSTAKQTKKRRTTITESDDDEEKPAVKALDKPSKNVVDDDEDAPLSLLTDSISGKLPSETELKENIISLLKTVNLEETSLKVVREKIFARYPGVDLSGKKEFINTTVKNYLSQS